MFPVCASSVVAAKRKAEHRSCKGSQRLTCWEAVQQHFTHALHRMTSSSVSDGQTKWLSGNASKESLHRHATACVLLYPLAMHLWHRMVCAICFAE